MAEGHMGNILRDRINVLKDNQLKDFVNRLTDLARRYANTQQLRGRVSEEVIETLRPSNETPPVMGNGESEIEELLQECRNGCEHVRIEKKPKIAITEAEIDWLAYTSTGDDFTFILDAAQQLKDIKTNGELMVIAATMRKQLRIKAIKDVIEFINNKA